jgi:hypothetical protein
LVLRFKKGSTAMERSGISEIISYWVSVTLF